MELPKVLIWRPEENDEVGHVALKTDKYYISIWPTRFLKDGNHIVKFLDGIQMMVGVEGCLVFNTNVDREYEAECDPIEYEIDVTVTNEDINSVYEEFLSYNEISPEEVTLTRGEELFKKCQEYKELLKSLSPEEAQKIEEPELPKTSPLKTKYSFSAGMVSRKEEGRAFFIKQQSCVSLAFNLLQTAWLKHHPDKPIPIRNSKVIPDFPVNNLGEEFYKVMWFDEVVQKYLMSISNNYYRSFIDPDSTGEIGVPFAIYMGKENEKPRDPPITLSQIYFSTIIQFVVYSVLAIFGYFFPVVLKPVVFAACAYHCFPFPMTHFLIGLFFMLLSYIFSVSVHFIILIVSYVIYDNWTFKIQQPEYLFEISLSLMQIQAGWLGIGSLRKELQMITSKLNKEDQHLLATLNNIKSNLNNSIIISFVYSVLAIFGYFFPVIRNPVVFAACAYYCYPFPMTHFLIGLFFMLLSVMLSVSVPFIILMVFYAIYDDCTSFVKMHRFGQM